jgi:hypothetical protein
MMECDIATLQVMRLQEDAYQVSDYLEESSSSSCHPSFYDIDRSVDVYCRRTMAEWCYSVVDFCRYDREVVSIAMSYLDRFLCTNVGQAVLFDRTEFQLTVMTCLYTAIKLFEPLAISPATFAALSHGSYTAHQIEDMEKIMLKALDWRMNPPTAVAFLYHFMKLLPGEMMKLTLRETVYELASIQIELSVCEHEFVTVKPSVIAFSALLNAVESVDESAVDELRSLLLTTSSINFESPLIEQTQQRLFEVIEKRPGSPLSSFDAVAKHGKGHSLLSSSAHASSPRSVVDIP